MESLSLFLCTYMYFLSLPMALFLFMIIFFIVGILMVSNKIMFKIAYIKAEVNIFTMLLQAGFNSFVISNIFFFTLTGVVYYREISDRSYDDLKIYMYSKMLKPTVVESTFFNDLLFPAVNLNRENKIILNKKIASITKDKVIIYAELICFYKSINKINSHK